MIRFKICALFSLLFIGVAESSKAQSAIDIFISEYSAANVEGPIDYFGQHSDWVEIQSTFSSSVSLQSYYLSDDPLNLKKWKFPDDFTLQPNEVKVVWLSGRNTVAPGGQVHANFSLDQCRDQWLILSTSQGTIRDQIKVRPMQRNHSRGRIDNKLIGESEWVVYTTPSFMQINSKTDFYKDYAPTPEIYISQETDFSKPNKGGFYPGSRICYIKLNGEDYDTTYQKCFNVFYTLSNAGANSDYPVPGYPPVAPTQQYYTKLNSPFTIDQSTVVRAIAVHNPTVFGCTDRYLPSFCETNTYFIDANQQNIAKDFGVLSLSFDIGDINWFDNAVEGSTIHVEYYENKQQVTEGYGILTRPPQEKWVTDQKGFYITMDDRLGFGCGFEGNIFNVATLGTSSRTIFPTLHVYAGDHESHSAYEGSAANESYGTAIRDVFLQSLAAKHDLKVSPLHVKPIVGVKDGKYWGVFTLKEVYDKYYEQYYYGQDPDSLTLNFVQYGMESHVNYWDKTSSAYKPKAWRNEVYDFIFQNNPLDNKSNYEMLMSVLDKESLIDYMIVNSYAVNTNLFNHDLAFAKGANPDKPGGKWHFYLWNAPSVFSFTNVPLPQQKPEFQMGRSPCYYYLRSYDAIPTSTTGNLAFMGVGNVFKRMMTTVDNDGTAIGQFQNQFRTRYMDLMNTVFNCKVLDAHWKAIYDMYLPEMKKHEDPGIGQFGSAADRWKSNMDSLRKIIGMRCFYHQNEQTPVFSQFNCFGLPGPYNVAVDVSPPGAGLVRLNSTLIDTFIYVGKYYSSQISFKAIPTSTNFVFHHWEFQNHQPSPSTRQDSVTIDLMSSQGETALAVFTDITKPITGGEGANIPTGFTPNGDGINDVFKPLGAAEFVTNYDFVIFNRWGQEVFRSTKPEIGWDGYFKGQPVITGVYAYVISYRNPAGEDVVVKGNVTLTR